MIRRLCTLAVILAGAALAASPGVQAEVYAEVDLDGRFIGMRTADSDRAGRGIWEPVGAAMQRRLVLNPDGDQRGDGRPSWAIDPNSGLPRVVWASRIGSDFEIVTSTFDGIGWTAPATVSSGPVYQDLDPRIVIRRDGTAIVAWWQKSPTPVVRAAYLPSSGIWYDKGVLSPAGVSARKPAIRQDGMVTIVAYRTPSDIGIVTFVVGAVSTDFGDGPTPFPKGGDDPPNGADPPELDP